MIITTIMIIIMMIIMILSRTPREARTLVEAPRGRPAGRTSACPVT